MLFAFRFVTCLQKSSRTVVNLYYYCYCISANWVKLNHFTPCDIQLSPSFRTGLNWAADAFYQAPSCRLLGSSMLWAPKRLYILVRHVLIINLYLLTANQLCVFLRNLQHSCPPKCCLVLHAKHSQLESADCFNKSEKWQKKNCSCSKTTRKSLRRSRENAQFHSSYTCTFNTYFWFLV